MYKLAHNPKWIAYNNSFNEGGEGYNPHPKYLVDAPEYKTASSDPKINYGGLPLLKSELELKLAKALHNSINLPGELGRKTNADEAVKIQAILAAQ